jgi:site-specific recombinase XerD
LIFNCFHFFADGFLINTYKDEKKSTTIPVSVNDLLHTMHVRMEVEHFANLVTIQKLMGHGDIRTTMIYLQLTHKNNLNQVISPLDRLQQ